jgi:hypothetical protein
MATQINLKTDLFSPQYHVVFYYHFTMVSHATTYTPLSNWSELFHHNRLNAFDGEPQDQTPSTLDPLWYENTGIILPPTNMDTAPTRSSAQCWILQLMERLHCQREMAMRPHHQQMAPHCQRESAMCQFKL